MKKKFKPLHAAWFLPSVLLFFFAVASSSAGEVDERIKALEETQRANAEELNRLKGEQMELKKEAVAAAAALPTFQYRPGSGLRITAADRSWSFGISYELDIRMYNHPDGKPVIRDPAGGTRISTGMTSGEFFGRRNRVYFSFCWVNCFYEFNQGLDMDTGDLTEQQINEFNVHFEQLNPYLPQLRAGTEVGLFNGSWLKSTTGDVRQERGMVRDGAAISVVGRHRGAGLAWNRVPVGPGDVTAFLAYGSARLGTSDNETADTDRKGILGTVSVQPFSKLKNKWINGLAFGLNWQATSISARAGLTSGNSEDDRIRIRSEDRRGRVTLFDANNVGSGPAIFLFPGLRWTVGPYAFFTNYTMQQAEGRNDNFRGVRTREFQLNNQLFVWSPKGFLTGSAATPGSVQIGWSFDRSEGECGKTSSGTCVGTDGAGGKVQRTVVLQNQWGIRYYIRPRMIVGLWWSRYDSSNTPERTQVAVGCANNITAANAGKRAGRSCDWDSINTGIYTRW